MRNFKDFKRVSEIRVTTHHEEFKALCAEGWVEIGVMLIPPVMASLIPAIVAIKGPYLGFVIVLGRLQEQERSVGDEIFSEPDPDKINQKLKEGWTLVGIVTGTTTAFSRYGDYFASSFALSR